MSKLKFSEQLFLGVSEYNRLQEFLNDQGFKRHTLMNTVQFGLIEDLAFPDLGVIGKENMLYVAKAGTPFGDVIVNEGAALDSSANLMINREKRNLSIPNSSLWYWIKVSHLESSEEIGKVSIDAFGNLIGVGTKFREVMRGQPNYPTKIKFKNSINGNSDEYEVVSVVSDTQMVLSGDFNMEADLEFSVIGTFTPGFAPSITNKEIYKYDSINITLVPETSFNQEPSSIQGREFFLARVRNNGINLSLQDKRKQWWRTNAVDYVKNIDRVSVNPLIGVESVNYDIETSTRAFNIINLAFGFRFKGYTIDTSSKSISILIGNGGKYKDTSFFKSGDFNGWRIYTKGGNWNTIIDSQKSGTQIVVTLDVLNPNDYLTSAYTGSEGDQLLIVPPYESIEVKVRKNDAILDTYDQNNNNDFGEPFPYPLLTETFSFPINTPLAELRVAVLKECYKYNLTYRFKVQNDYTDWKKFPDDNIGFYSETSFDKYGNLLKEVYDRNLKPYVGHETDGFIEVCPHPNSFFNFQSVITTGDLFGVNTTAFANEVPIVTLEVGVNKRYQHFKGLVTLEANIVVHLKRLDGSGFPYREGNEFFLHIDQFISLQSYSIKIVEDYINPTNYRLVREITANDIAYIKNNTNDSDAQADRSGLMIHCTYNDSNRWIAHMSSDTTPKGTVRMIKADSSNNFNSSLDGIKKGFWGWKVITDMEGRIPMGTTNFNIIGERGGSNSITLIPQNIPPHYHLMFQDRGNGDLTNNNYPSWHYSSGGNLGYSIKGNPTQPSLGRTNTVGGETSGQTRAFNINPSHVKFLFIEKIV